MGNLKNPKFMYLKAVLYLGILLMSCGMIIAAVPKWQVVFLLVLVVWASARIYYFMFYVIEKYVDSSYRFSGVGSFVAYLARNRQG